MDMMHIRHAMQAMQADGQLATMPWIHLIRANCEVLYQLRPEMAQAISVSVRLASDSTAEVEALQQVSRLIAPEMLVEIEADAVVEDQR